MEKPYIIEGNGEVADILKTQKIINVLKNKAYEEDIYYEIIDNYEIDEEEIEEYREEIEELARENNNLDEDEEIAGEDVVECGLEAYPEFKMTVQ